MSLNFIILLLVLLVGCVSVTCVACLAIPRLIRERVALQDFETKFKGFVDTERQREQEAEKKAPLNEAAKAGPYERFLAYKGRWEVPGDGTQAITPRHYPKAKELAEEWGNGDTRNSRYIFERLFVILCSVSTANKVRTTPPLTDLHELTMQQERGQLSTATFRALTPAILVIGILGTLVGVHHQLGDPRFLEGGIDQLVSALGPGIIAVAVTIVCIILRGMYNTRYANYTKQLDEFTQQHLLPYFQTRGISEEDATASAKNVELLSQLRYSDFFNAVKDYNSAVKGGQKTCDTSASYCRKCMEALAKTRGKIQAVRDLADAHLDSMEKELGIADDLAKRVALQGATLAERLRGISGQVVATAENATRQDPGAAAELWSKVYGYSRIIRDNSSQEIETVQTRSAALTAWTEHCKRLQEQQAAYAEYAQEGGLLPQTDNYLQELVPYLAHLKDSAIRQKEELLAEGCAPAVDEKIRGRMNRLLDDYAAAAVKVQELEAGRQAISEHLENMQMYPGGWQGLKLQLRDRLDRTRNFLYRTAWGRLCCVACMAGYGAMLFLVPNGHAKAAAAPAPAMPGKSGKAKAQHRVTGALNKSGDSTDRAQTSQKDKTNRKANATPKAKAAKQTQD